MGSNLNKLNFLQYVFVQVKFDLRLSLFNPGENEILSFLRLKLFMKFNQRSNLTQHIILHMEQKLYNKSATQLLCDE